MKNEYIENNNYYSLIIDDKYEVKFDKEYLNIVKKVKWKYKKEHNEVRTTNSNQTMGYFLFGENANKKVLRRKQTLDYRKENIYINNIYSKHEGFYEVECYDGKKFTIDEDDYELSKQYVWHIDKNNYVITKLKNGRVIKQHRLFLGVIDEKGIEVDHINHQTTDNRRCNLRLSDRSLNCLNRRRGKCNKSGTVGVYEQSQGYGWIAQLKTGNGNNKYLGCFKTKEEAIKARLTEEQKYNISTEW